MSKRRVVFVESNTTGTGRLFAQIARACDLEPLLLTSDPARYPYVYEDGLDWQQIDTADTAAVLDACAPLASRRELAGVTSSSEYFILAAATACRQFGLPGPDPLAIQRCRDKAEQRRTLQAAGVDMPAFRPVTSVQQALGAAQELGYPVVIKPVSGSGSVGVRLCASPEEAAAHAEALLRTTHNERGMPIPRLILVEQQVLGPEFSVESFSNRIIGITAKQLGPPPYFVETGHVFPANLPDEAVARLNSAVFRTLEALGAQWGPCHTELRLTAQGPKIIEVNPRLAGGFIPELVQRATGVNLIGATIRLVVGLPVDIEPTRQQHAAIRFVLAPCEGRLQDVAGLELARQTGGVADIQLYRRAGDHIRLHGDFRDRIGHVIAVGDNAGAARAADLAIALIAPQIG